MAEQQNMPVAVEMSLADLDRLKKGEVVEKFWEVARKNGQLTAMVAALREEIAKLEGELKAQPKINLQEIKQAMGEGLSMLKKSVHNGYGARPLSFFVHGLWICVARARARSASAMRLRPRPHPRSRSPSKRSRSRRRPRRPSPRCRATPTLPSTMTPR